MKKTIILSCVIIGLQACSSIKQPTASVSLVNHDFNNSHAPAPDWMASALTSRQGNSDIRNGADLFTIEEKYFSASGQTCRKVNKNSTERLLYCQAPSGEWQHVKFALAEYESPEKNAAVSAGASND